MQDHKIFKVQKSINDNQISFDIPTLKYLIVRVNKFFPISKLWVCSLPQIVNLVPTGKLLLVNKRNHTCRMHLLHLRSVKWGPLLELAQNFHFSENAEFSVNWLVSFINPLTSDALT